MNCRTCGMPVWFGTKCYETPTCEGVEELPEEKEEAVDWRKEARERLEHDISLGYDPITGLWPGETDND